MNGVIRDAMTGGGISVGGARTYVGHQFDIKSLTNPAVQIEKRETIILFDMMISLICVTVAVRC
jgi:hypothetical protein